MRRITSMLLLTCVLAAIATAQKPKPWNEWTDKEVKRILDSSGWGQVQTETGGSGKAVVDMDPSKGVGNMNSVPAHEATPDRAANSNQGGGPGNTTIQPPSNGPASTDYHFRLLSAKPIREALVRNIELTSKKSATDDQKAFIDRPVFGQFIIVSVAITGRSAASGALTQLKADDLKDNVYLERADGKRLALKDFRPLSGDGLGAKFFFPRTSEDGKPFVSPEAGVLKFYAEVPPPAKPDQKTPPQKANPIKLTAKFKVADMMYGDHLEY